MNHFDLKSFEVESLNGVRTVRTVFNNNRLILIGENGTGKSTLLTMLYFVLSCQWHRLYEFDFSTITIAFQDRTFQFTSQELQHYVDDLRSRRGTSRINLEILRYIKKSEHAPEHILNSSSLMREALISLRKSNMLISEKRLREGLLDAVHLFNAEGDLLTGQISSLSTYLSSTDLQIIFLPTYRRIERDLKTLFPNLEDAIRERVETTQTPSRSNLVELVEFGMEDVQDLIDERLNSLRGTFQADVNNLFGEYLRDVLRGNYAYITPSDVQAIDAASLDAILSRLDEQTLPANDRRSLREKVNIFSTGALTTIADQVVAHFLVKLHSLQKTQLAREESFRNFVDLCNSYLVGKEIKFDSVSFTVKIALPNSSSVEDQEETIELSDLSSGEKQVISLFAHLSMGSAKSQFLLIDEPELSLSVPWQKRFLQDISRTARCVGFLAVTHSPFIYDNELEQYAHGINEFVTHP